MYNINYQNPTQLILGKNTIKELPRLIPESDKILLLYGKGSIKKNGVYDQVMSALKGRQVMEFGGIEANPRYETLMKAVAICHKEKINFLLAVGGGSVLDGTKFVAAAVNFAGKDPWEILSKRITVKTALPLGSVLTLPATGSEMNSYFVVSRESSGEKLASGGPAVYPKFSILDPQTTYSLPPRQVGNGIVDAFVHVMEQYCTFSVNNPLQDRLAEGILSTLVEEGPKTLKNPSDYESRANLMFCATSALNGWIGTGVPQDWATHMIGHELTALYGIDHGQSLAVVLPALLRFKKDKKGDKLAQFAKRVWGTEDGSKEELINQAIEKMRSFFESVGVKTHLSDYGMPKDAPEAVYARLSKRPDLKLGENQDITAKDVKEILEMCA